MHAIFKINTQLRIRFTIANLGVVYIFKLNKSAARTIDIVRLLAKSNKPLTQLDISQMLDLPKSSTYELIYTMLDKGLIEFDNETAKTFKLSMHVFEIGMTVIEKSDITKVSRPYLEKLSADTNETVFLAVEDQGSIVYLDRVEESSSITTAAGLGKRRPMYCTGLGKALLATYATARVKEIWDKVDKTAYTNSTVMNYDELLLQCEQIRKRGYSIDNREMENEIFCVAAPIYDRLDKAVGAISIATLYLKMDEERTAAFGQLITETALAISRRLGFRREKLFSAKE